MQAAEWTPAPRRSAVTAELVALAAGFVAIYLVLDGSARVTNSVNGEYGALVCVLVIAAALLVERLVFATAPFAAVWALGLGRPTARGLLVALVVSLVLLAYFPILALATGQALALRDGWALIAVGVFLQGGITEELLWRGYVFRHLRATRTFWRAASLVMLFIVAQHTLLVFQFSLPLALAALAVSLATSFPLAYQFELDANTIWGVALLHAVIQGALKIVVVPEPYLLPAQLGWMALSVVVPYLVFLARRPAGWSSAPSGKGASSSAVA